MSDNTIDTNALGEKIVMVLKTIYDPEIPVDIYELGLIYDVFVSDENNAKILMTLTSPNCPVAESLPVEIEDKVKSLKELNKQLDLAVANENYELAANIRDEISKRS